MPTIEGEGGRSGTRSGSAGGTVTGADRRGAPWSDAENVHVVRGLRAGRSVKALAAEIGRTVGAVRSQVAKMVPPGVTAGGRGSVVWVRARLRADEGFDWRAGLRDRSEMYWSGDDDGALRQAWDARVPLPRVAGLFGIAELAVHSRLMALGLSRTHADTVEKMGCSAGGVLEARYHRERGEAVTATAVLVVDGFLARDRTVRRVISVHTSREAAHAALRALGVEHRTRAGFHAAYGRAVPAARWEIGVRRYGTGENVLGHDESGTLTG